jgi:hypothetical protein
MTGHEITVCCPWARSDMTPCVMREGEVCYAPSRDHSERSCVGCGAPPEAVARERARQAEG